MSIRKAERIRSNSLLTREMSASKPGPHKLDYTCRLFDLPNPNQRQSSRKRRQKTDHSGGLDVCGTCHHPSAAEASALVTCVPSLSRKVIDARALWRTG